MTNRKKDQLSYLKCYFTSCLLELNWLLKKPEELCYLVITSFFVWLTTKHAISHYRLKCPNLYTHGRYTRIHGYNFNFRND